MEIRLKIENGPSKEEEKTILFKLWDTYRVAAPDSYLVNLFSQEFIGWCKNQINNDFTCNAYEYIEAGTDSINMKTDLDEAMSRVVDLEQSALALEADYKDREKEATKFKNRYEDANKIIHILRDSITVSDSNVGSLMDEKESLEIQVMKLKSEIYDLRKEGK